jgi:hypothetical protein
MRRRGVELVRLARETHGDEHPVDLERGTPAGDLEGVFRVVR